MVRKYEHIISFHGFELYLGSDGYWLRDQELKMNVSIRASGVQDALIEALGYYQDTLKRERVENLKLENKLNAIVNIVIPEEGGVNE